jgi:hypothetical protein
MRPVSSSRAMIEKVIAGLRCSLLEKWKHGTA